jgi:hypothetical protein
MLDAIKHLPCEKHAGNKQQLSDALILFLRELKENEKFIIHMLNRVSSSGMGNHSSVIKRLLIKPLYNKTNFLEFSLSKNGSSKEICMLFFLQNRINSESPFGLKIDCSPKNTWISSMLVSFFISSKIFSVLLSHQIVNYSYSNCFL